GTVCEFFAITEEAAEKSGPKRDGAGPIGDFWIESEPDKNGKRQQRPSAGNGIDRARRKRGAEHDKHGEETHRGVLELQPHVNIKTPDAKKNFVPSVLSLRLCVKLISR